MKCVIRHLDEKFVCHENAISKAKKYNKKISIIINLFLLIIISMLKVLFPTRQLLKSNKLIPLHNKKKTIIFHYSIIYYCMSERKRSVTYKLTLKIGQNKY